MKVSIDVPLILVGGNDWLDMNLAPVNDIDLKPRTSEARHSQERRSAHFGDENALPSSKPEQVGGEDARGFFGAVGEGVAAGKAKAQTKCGNDISRKRQGSIEACIYDGLNFGDRLARTAKTQAHQCVSQAVDVSHNWRLSDISTYAAQCAQADLCSVE